LSDSIAQPSFLATGRGNATLALLTAVGFLDFIDASIVNIALPEIRNDLDFSVQGLQWVISGYLLTTAASCCSAAGWPTCSADAASWSAAPSSSRPHP
jgi:MFS family permease